MTKSSTVSVLGGILDKALASYRAKTNTSVKSYASMTDEELISLVQGGEDQAYEEVIKRFQGKIYAYIMRLTNHPEEAKEIMQDVFMKAYKHLHRFDTERKFSSWVYRIAHNESVNWLKKKTRAKLESLEVHRENGKQVDAGLDTHELFVRSEDKNSVKEAISKLPEKYREVMELRYFDELSYDEISEKLDKPVNTIGTLINRAKKKLSKDYNLINLS